MHSPIIIVLTFNGLATLILAAALIGHLNWHRG